MNSAFGVSHEINKARRGPRFRRVSADATAREQARQARPGVGEKIGNAGRKAAGFTTKVTNTKVSMADIGHGVGTGTAKVGTGIGRVLNYKPGLTGAAVIGGGDYALYRHGNNKKKTVNGVVTKSAFGVNHDVSKAIRFPGVKPFGPGAAKATKYMGDAEKHLVGMKKAPVTKKPKIGGGQLQTKAK